MTKNDRLEWIAFAFYKDLLFNPFGVEQRNCRYPG
jgi:hypothetical protein